MCLSYTAKCLGRLPKRDALNNHSDKLKKREREEKRRNSRFYNDVIKPIRK